MSPASAIDPDRFATFGDLLKFLRQRAGLSQRELSIAVGYTDSHISRLEHNQRAPDAAVLAARFVPALGLAMEPAWVERLLALAGAPAQPSPPAGPALGASPPPGNLPAELTSFIGRERELAEINTLLADPASRLLTLTGAGGSGKTRLALRAAAAALPAFPDGVWFVDLAPVSDPQYVGLALVRTLGLLDDPQRTPLAVTIGFLKSRTALLIFDNCEHVIAEAAQAAAVLLPGCPALRLLATSREALGIAGEVIYHVPTLRTPVPADQLDLDDVAHYEAVRLFVDRARLAFPAFGLTAANAPAIVQICWQIDGIPLAVELAAARVQTLRVEQIASRLAAVGRFGVLTGGSRTAPPRQQTLLAMIEWSHALLSEPERVLFRRLAVFAGGWTLAAAEAVCGGHSDDLVSSAVLDTLTQLANKSLVIVDRQLGLETRYRQLETIRHYARERLWAAGEGETFQQRHLDYFVMLAEQAEPQLRGPDQLSWLDRIEVEHGNVRAALAQAVEGDVQAGLRLAAALHWFWWIREHRREGGDWLSQLLNLEAAQRGHRPLATEPALVRGRALNSASMLLEVVHHRKLPRDIFTESLALHRSLGLAGRQGLAQALINATLGDLASLAMLQESRQLFEAVGDRFGLAECLSLLSEVTWTLLGDFELARRLSQEHVALRQALGDWDGLASALVRFGFLSLEWCDYLSAAAMCSEAVQIFRQLSNKWGTAWALANLADAHVGLGEYALARQHYEEARERGRALGDRFTRSNITFGLAYLELSEGHYAEAVHVCSVAVGEARAASATWAVCLGQYLRAKALWSAGQYEQARQCCEEARALGQAAEEVGPLHRAFAIYGLGIIDHAEGKLASARAHLSHALREWRGSGRVREQSDALEAIAVVLTDEKNISPAVRLFGATQRSHDVYRYFHSPWQRGLRESAVTAARTQLGAAAFNAAFAAGQGLTLNQAIDYALTLGPD